MKRTTVILITFLFLTTSAQAESANEWVVKRMQARIAKNRDTTMQQIDPPAALAPKANLADLTDATEFVSLAAGFTGIGDNADDETQSVTVNAYTLYAGAFGLDPTDLAVRYRHQGATNWFFTLGTKEGTDTTPAARSYQVKHLLYDARRLSTAEQDELLGLMRDVAGANSIVERTQGIVLRSEPVLAQFIIPRYTTLLRTRTQFTEQQISDRVRNLRGRIQNRGPLTTVPGDPAELTALETAFWLDLGTGVAQTLTTSEFPAVKKVLTEADLEAIDALINEQLGPATALDERGRTLVAKMQRRAQFAWTGTLVDQQNEAGRKTFSLQGIFAKGLTPTTNLTLNATYDRPEGEVGDDDSAKVAAQIRKQLRGERASKKAMFLDIAADSSLLDDDRIYRAQAKVTVPILRGLQIPISVTWANRDELVDESNVTGHIGISFDFTNIAEFFKRSANAD